LRRTLGGCLSAARTHALEAIIGASSRTIAIVLIGAFSARITAGHDIYEMIRFTSPRTIAAILI